jgi:nicotinamide phosphoribosyltransferase
MNKNIILATDSYKLIHWTMYPKDTEYVYSYFESRKGATYDETVFFGLQPILRLLTQKVTHEDIEKARLISAIHFGQATLKSLESYKAGEGKPRKWTKNTFNEVTEEFYNAQEVGVDYVYDLDKYFKDNNISEYFNLKMWRYIVDNLNGMLPVRIRAVPEGTVVPVSNVMMDVVNTDPNCAALTNGLESYLTHVWYPSTVATQSRACKKVFEKYLNESAVDFGGVNFMLHDFGYRGVSSDESAAIGGAGHLVNFMGTDTLAAMIAAIDWYGANPDGLAYSVPATEHSIMTARGRDGEEQVVGEMLDAFPTGILSIVADSYDIYNFVDNIVGKTYKDRILAREGVFVIRPDSVTPEHPFPETEVVWILNSLWNSVGGTVNAKGFKVINPKIRVLWGDGLDMEDIEQILKYAVEEKFYIENLVFGMGGGLLQKINRDTQRFAFKSAAQCRSGVWYDIFKQPKDESKMSKKGRLKLVWQEESHGKFLVTVPETDSRENVLQTVFENGKILKKYTFDEVRQNAKMRTLKEIYPTV